MYLVSVHHQTVGSALWTLSFYSTQLCLKQTTCSCLPEMVSWVFFLSEPWSVGTQHVCHPNLPVVTFWWSEVIHFKITFGSPSHPQNPHEQVWSNARRLTRHIYICTRLLSLMCFYQLWRWFYVGVVSVVIQQIVQRWYCSSGLVS